MAKPSDLTPYAQAGYRGEKNPNLWSSPAWFAHEIGLHFLATGRPAPSDVRMSRGYTVRVRDLIFAHKDGSFERIN